MFFDQYYPSLLLSPPHPPSPHMYYHHSPYPLIHQTPSSVILFWLEHNKYQFLKSAFVGYGEFCTSRRVLSTEAESLLDNTPRDLQYSSYPTKADFNNCFIIGSKYFHS